MSNPMIQAVDDLAEGVYMASGVSTQSGGCYTASAYIHQTPETGRGDYRIQVNGKHAADHTVDEQDLHITFNQPVTYSSSQGTLTSAGTGTTLDIHYRYHNNPTDNIGLGDLIVVSDPGLEVVSVSITDDEYRH